MSAMLGVIETSLAGSPMKVLHLEHAGRRPVPTSSFSQTAAQRPQNRRFAGVPKEPKSRDLHHTFSGAQVSLGGLRRSFAAVTGAVRLRFRSSLVRLRTVHIGRGRPMTATATEPIHLGTYPAAWNRIAIHEDGVRSDDAVVN